MIYIVNKATEADVLQHFGDIKSDGVGYERETPKVVWNRFLPSYKAGTIVLSKNEELDFCYYTDYVAGDWTGWTKEGIIVAPATHFDDKKNRMIPLTGVGQGGGSGARTQMYWSSRTGDTKLSNYDLATTWSNDPYNPNYSGSNLTTYIPSTRSDADFSGATCATDSKAKYWGAADLLSPSPYLEDESLNPAFRAEIAGAPGRNGFSDVDGYGNTIIFSSDTSKYAAYACYKFKNGNNGGLFTAEGAWYLPALGELAYVASRFNEIQSAMSSVGGLPLPVGNNVNNMYWSSTEWTKDWAKGIHVWNSANFGLGKTSTTAYVIPFAKV